MTLSNIQEGMTWSEVFEILNALINDVIEIKEALGSTLVDGKIDYEAIINKPSINGVELSGDKSHESLKIEIGSTIKSEIKGLGARVSDAEGVYGTLESRAESLESFEEIYKPKVDDLEDNRTDDVERIAALEGNRTTDSQAIQQLQNRLGDVDTSIAALATQQSLGTTAAQRVLELSEADETIVAKINTLINSHNRLAEGACQHNITDVCLTPIQQLDISDL